MKPRHIALGVLIAAVWGFNFVPIKFGLESFPPLLLLALRFILAGLPIFFLPKPNVSWGKIFAIAVPMFIGQFALLFIAMSAGMPPGLASIVLQVQAFFTTVIAALVLREKPTVQQISGCIIAFAGLGLIATTVGGDVTLLGLALCVCGALCWSMGNVMMRRLPQIDPFALVVWMSASVALPTLALSFIFEGPSAIAYAFTHAHLLGVLGLLYVVLASTLLGYGLWGYLMHRYPAGMVAPFTLLVPIFGTFSAYLVFGEQFAPLRLLGMVFILTGLAVIVLRLPARRAEPLGPS